MRRGRFAVPLAAAAIAITLCGCSAAHPSDAAPSQSAWLEQSRGASTAPASAAFRPGASASDNRAAFDSVIRRVLATNPQADGDAVVTALKAAGFPMGATQVTASTTSADLQPGSIMVGVKLGKQCLVGQWGTAVDGYQSTIAPVLSSGGCLIGGIPVVG